MEPSNEELQEILKIFGESNMSELHLSIAGTQLIATKGRPPSFGPGRAEADRRPAASVPTREEPAHEGQEQQGPAHEGQKQRARSGPDAEVPHGPEEGQHAPDSLVEITSPLVGTFYERPAPDSEPYVSQGSRVEAGTPVGIIEMMKMFTEVKAERAGTVVQLCVADGQFVEYGEVLMRLRPE